MKIGSFLALSFCLFAANISANDTSNEVPFEIRFLEIDEDDGDDLRSPQPGGWGMRGIGHSYLNNQICQAIQSRSQLQIVQKVSEVENPKERKITTRLITIEPYAFGMTKDGFSVLKGNVVDQKDLKVVTIKVFEDRFEKKETPPAFAENHRRWFKSDTGVKLLALQGVRGVRVLPNNHFDLPKDFKGFQDDKDIQIQTICSLPVNNGNQQAQQNDQHN